MISTSNVRPIHLVCLSMIVASCGDEAPEVDTTGTPDAQEAAAPRSAAPSGPSLWDHAWRLVTIDMMDGDDFEPPSGSEPTVVFSQEADPTGSRLLNGSTGCNSFNATYDAGRGGRLAVSPAAMTRMACEEDVMRIEQVFLIGLESASTYTIDEESLAIDFGGGVLHFVPATDEDSG